MNYGNKPEHEGDISYGRVSAHDVHLVKVTEISLSPLLFIVVGICILAGILYSRRRTRT